MPDRLEDVEGFMGMEEVDGVDVLRTDDGGLIYKVFLHPERSLGVHILTPSLPAQVIEVPHKARKKAATTKTNSAKPEKEEQQQEEEKEEEEQEWGGIDDKPNDKIKQKAKRKQKKRKEKRHAAAAAEAAEAAVPQSVLENAFDLLPEEDEDGRAPHVFGVCLLFPNKST